MIDVVEVIKDANNKVKYVMIKFDNEKAGKHRRQEIKFSRFPEAAEIAILEQQFNQGTDNSTPVTAINWSINLRLGSILHEI